MTAVTNAAGAAKTTEQAVEVLATSSPAVVLGSYTLAERAGNDGVVDYFGDLYSVNVRGIPSASATEWARTVATTVDLAHRVGKQVVVSVAAFAPKEYGTLARIASESGADAVECNFGCPNMQEGESFAPIISYRPVMVREALASVRSELDDEAEVWAKVSPVFDDALFCELSEALRAATGVVAVNTVPQCLVLRNRQPVLTFGSGLGGMAGPAIKPIALAQAAKYVREGFRVVGVGGISSPSCVKDYSAMGVEGCQVNSVLQQRGMGVLDELNPMRGENSDPYRSTA